MRDILVKDILEICKDAKLICGNPEERCRNFSKDTRTIEKGDVYIGIKGERFDGNLFYGEAITRGAKVCILQGVSIPKKMKDESNVTIILVEDTVKALQKIAQKKRSLYQIPVVAITGSVGKTSTKDIVASVLKQKFQVLKTEGNLNNHIGLPMTILKLKEEEALVVEMGMNNLGEISVLSNIAKPTVAVITNVGTSHIGNLGSRENILRAKLEILEGLATEGKVVINNDNDLLHEWYEEKGKNDYSVITYGIQNKSEIMAKDIEITEAGSTFTAVRKEENYEIEVPIAGQHFVYNSLCAIAVAQIYEIKKDKIQKGISEFELTKRRMDIEQIGNYTIINDCYNANYDSMKAAIEYLGKTNKQTKIAILGDMLELGEFSEELHRKVGEEIQKNKIDILITVGFFSQYINEVAKTNQNIHCETKEEAIEAAKKQMKPDSSILIKASNSMKFDEIANQLSQYLKSL